MNNLKALQIKLLEQCFRHSKHHLGSAFSTLPIIREIYEEFQEGDRVVLSNGHASAALFICLEEYMGIDSEFLFDTMGDHPKRDIDSGVYCSTGSLGMGITVAVGMAIARPKNKIYCVISDGECAEGSVWEALRYAKNASLNNLEIFVNLNGWTAYDSIESEKLAEELSIFFPRVNLRFTSTFPFEKEGLGAHYSKLNEKDFVIARERICAQNL